MYHETYFWVYSWMFTLVLVLWLVKKDLHVFKKKIYLQLAYKLLENKKAVFEEIE